MQVQTLHSMSEIKKAYLHIRTAVCTNSRDGGKLKTIMRERAISAVLPYSKVSSRKLTAPTVSVVELSAYEPLDDELI